MAIAISLPVNPSIVVTTVREHQININIKAQQFEQLQKLAREHGFKSVTSYLKIKMLDLLLSPGELSAVSHAQNPIQNAQIEELERLHKELRGFVAELSGQGQVLPEPTSPPSIPAPKSPIPPMVSKSYQGLDVAPPGEDFIQRPLPTDSSSQNLSTNFKSENSPAPENEAGQVLPSSNLGGFGFGLGSFLGSSPSRSGNLFNTDKLGSYRDILDDLEEMADRAFAISPRLGPLDEVAPETKYTSDEADENENENENDTQTGEPSADELAPLTSFVEPIVPANLPDYTASLVEETPFSGVSSGTYSSLGEFHTITAFAEEDSQPTFVPPPPPTPPKPIKAAVPSAPAPPQVDDILSDLLDESLIRLASQTVSTSLSSQEVSSPESTEAVIPEEDWQESTPEELNATAEVLNEELLEENPEEQNQEDEVIDQVVNSFPEDKDEELPSGKPPIPNLGTEPGSTSEEPSSVGFSSLSGGPPPKRRRR
jgi:hypothetical protein